MYNSREKYEEMVNQYYQPLYRLLFGYCSNSQDVEDCMQTAFLRLWQCKKVFISESHAKNWLYKVAVNYAIDIHRSRWRQMQPIEDNISFYTDDAMDLFEEISDLPDDYRIVILLFYYEDYSIKEISRILDVKESTIATRLQRAREKLKNKLEEDYEK